MTSWGEFSRKHIFSPNGLSVLRGLLGCLIPFLLFSPEPRHHVLAFFIFIFAAITDYLDGLVARMFSMETKIGKFVDPLADKVLMLATLIAFSLIGLYSIWWVVPIVIREVVVTFCRIGWVLEEKVIGAEKLGKLKLCLQVATIGFAFFHFLTQEISWLGPHFEFYDMGLRISLVITTAMTVVSGWTFLRNQKKAFRSPEFAKYVTAFGVGLLKPAPGTWGSLLGLLIVLFSSWNIWLYSSLFVAVVLVGAWAFNRLEGATKDPSFVVVDEVAGIFITFLFIPLNWLTVLVGFFLFRLFDITKPFPLRRLEKISGYWGVLFDDLGAGLYAWLILFFLFVR